METRERSLKVKKMSSNIKTPPKPGPVSTIFSPLFNCAFYIHVSNAGESITCQDPILGVGEPGKVIQKLCRFSNITRSRESPIGGIITYRCVGSQWQIERNDCISAPINALLQLAKVILKPLTLSSWWGAMFSWAYFSALRKMDFELLCVALKATLVYFRRRCNPRHALYFAWIPIERQHNVCYALGPAVHLHLGFC